MLLYHNMPSSKKFKKYAVMLASLQEHLLYLSSKCAAVIGSNRVKWCKLIWGIDRFTGSLVNKCRNLTGSAVYQSINVEIWPEKWSFKTPGRTTLLRNQNHTLLQYTYVFGQNVKWFVEIKYIANLKKSLFVLFIAT